jgi:TRAP transporter 4TM/12TM fusion protein
MSDNQRKLPGVYQWIFYIIGISFTIFELVNFLIYPFNAWTLRSIHLSLSIILTFSIYRCYSGGTNGRPNPLDYLLMFLAIVPSLYIVWEVNRDLYGFSMRLTVDPSLTDIFVAVVTIITLLEATRRVMGLTMPIIVLIFVLYAIIGHWIPGPFQHQGYSLSRVMTFNLGLEGIYGSTLGVSATYVFLFVLFGSFLRQSGAAEAFTVLAKSIAGGYRGGTAKIAVVSSTLFGTISGSAVANAVTTGTFTIPLMIGSGFRPYFAGAVEAAAATGGILVPPVMGAAAFLLADIVQVPYSQVVIAAILPSYLYLLGVFWVVDCESRKQKILGIPRCDLPVFGQVIISHGHLLIPIIVLLFIILVPKMSVIRAALWSILTIVIVSWMQKDTRMYLGKILESLYEGATGIIPVATACASAGIIIGIMSLTGIGVSLTNILLDITGHNLFLLLITTAIVCIILGVGVPGVAAYAITASVSAPALVDMGIAPLTAHMFVFYFSALAPVTPPVAVATFATAAIAKANIWKTGITAFKLASAGYIVPFAFIFGPVLLLQGGTPIEYILAGITATIGVLSLGSALIGYIFKSALWYERVFLGLGAIVLILPGWKTDLLGIGFILVALASQIFVLKAHKVTV